MSLDRTLEDIINDRLRDYSGGGGGGGYGGGGGFRSGWGGGKGGRWQQRGWGSQARSQSRARSMSYGGWGRQAGGGWRQPRWSGGGFRSQPYGRSMSMGRGGGGTTPLLAMGMTRCYVWNLPDDWSEDEILQVFQTVGPVIRLTLFSLSDGRPTGSAIVQYQRPQGARAAVLDLNGATLSGKIMYVNYSKGKGGKGGGKGGGGGGRTYLSSWGKGGGYRAGSYKGGGKGWGGGWGGKGRAWSQGRAFSQGRSMSRPRQGGWGGWGGGGGGGRVVRSVVSKEDLDSQLDRFVATN